MEIVKANNNGSGVVNQEKLLRFKNGIAKLTASDLSKYNDFLSYQVQSNKPYIKEAKHMELINKADALFALISSDGVQIIENMGLD